MRTIEHLDARYCAILAPLIRDSDRAEVYASHGILDMEQCLLDSIAISHESWCWVIDGEPVAAFGVAPGSYLTRQGIPWLLATDALERHTYSFVKNSKIIVDYWLTKWDVLSNYVDARNEHSIKWLKSLGFTIHDPVICGYEERLFHRFEKQGGVHV
jgi:hypothetical protein